jgi:large conductance mechanosensitive channel
MEYTPINLHPRDWEQVKEKSFSYWNSFKGFISGRGDILSLATAFIIGGAFKSIVTSLVDDILMPPIGLLPGANLENWFVLLKHGKNVNVTYSTIQEAQSDGAVTLNIGPFLLHIINFIIIAIFLWLVVQLIVGLKEKIHLQEQEDAMPSTRQCMYCFEDIKIEASVCKHCTREQTTVNC